MHGCSGSVSIYPDSDVIASEYIHLSAHVFVTTGAYNQLQRSTVQSLQIHLLSVALCTPIEHFLV